MRKGNKVTTNKLFKQQMEDYESYPVQLFLDVIEEQIEKYRTLAIEALGNAEKLEIADKILNPELDYINHAIIDNFGYDEYCAMRTLKINQVQTALNIDRNAEDSQCLVDYIVSYSEYKFVKSAICEIIHEYVRPYDEGDYNTAILIYRARSFDIDSLDLEGDIYFEIEDPDWGFAYKQIIANIAWPEWVHVIFSDVAPLEKVEGCDSYISLAQYAKMHNVDISTVRKKIRAGNLPAVKPGHDWLIKKNEPWIDLRRKNNKSPKD